LLRELGHIDVQAPPAQGGGRGRTRPKARRLRLRNEGPDIQGVWQISSVDGPVVGYEGDIGVPSRAWVESTESGLNDGQWSLGEGYTVKPSLDFCRSPRAGARASGLYRRPRRRRVAGRPRNPDWCSCRPAASPFSARIERSSWGFAGIDSNSTVVLNVP
jgi:hypothetical protein